MEALMIRVQTENFGMQTTLKCATKKGPWHVEKHIHQFWEIIFVREGELTVEEHRFKREVMVSAEQYFVFQTVDIGIHCSVLRSAVEIVAKHYQNVVIVVSVEACFLQRILKHACVSVDIACYK